MLNEGLGPDPNCYTYILRILQLYNSFYYKMGVLASDTHTYCTNQIWFTHFFYKLDQMFKYSPSLHVPLKHNSASIKSKKEPNSV